MQLKFNGFTWNDVTIGYGYYFDGSPAMRLFTDEGPLADATVWVDRPLPESADVWIKNYAENTGIAEALQDAGVIELVGDPVGIGVGGSAEIVAARLAH